MEVDAHGSSTPPKARRRLESASVDVDTKSEHQ